MSYRLANPSYYRSGPMSQPITINTVTTPAPTPAAPASTPAAPAGPIKKAGSLLKTLGMTALMATGGGGLVAAGGYGAYSLHKEPRPLLQEPYPHRKPHSLH